MTSSRKWSEHVLSFFFKIIPNPIEYELVGQLIKMSLDKLVGMNRVLCVTNSKAVHFSVTITNSIWEKKTRKDEALGCHGK